MKPIFKVGDIVKTIMAGFDHQKTVVCLVIAIRFNLDEDETEYSVVYKGFVFDRLESKVTAHTHRNMSDIFDSMVAL